MKGHFRVLLSMFAVLAAGVLLAACGGSEGGSSGQQGQPQGWPDWPPWGWPC